MKIPNKFNRMGISLTVDEALPPLTFTANEANSTVTLNATGSPVVSGLQYRTSKDGEWTPYTIGTTLDLANINDIVQFQNTANSLNTNYNSYVNFALTGSIAGSGNAMSLYNYSDTCPKFGLYKLFTGNNSLITAPELPATTISQQCYQAMFQGCKYLTQVPSVLPASTMATSCYYQMFDNCNRITKAPAISATTMAGSCFYQMFYWCNNLINAPELRATTMASGCYQYMFANCLNLRTAPALPATNLSIGYCYQGMFQNCRELTTAPELPNITSSGSSAMSSMFSGCSKLNNIKVHFTSWDNVKTDWWVEYVSGQGTFYKPSALPETYSVSKIPSGWTVVNID